LKHKQVLFLSLVSIAIISMAILAFWALNNYQVVNKGQILPYTEGFIYEILIAGKYTIYVEPEIRPRSDVFNAAILLGVAYISMTFSAIVFQRNNKPTSQRFWFFVTMSAGMFYLAADELFGIHESIGHNLQFLMTLPGLSHPDDLIVAAYGVFALIYLFYFRSTLLQMRRSLKYFGLAFLFFLVAAIADLATIGYEEIYEIISGVFILAGIVSFGLESLQVSETESELTK